MRTMLYNSVPLQLCSSVIPSGSLNIEFNRGSQEAAKQGDSKLKGSYNNTAVYIGLKRRYLY